MSDSKAQRLRLVLACLVLFLSAASATGCSPATRYKVLTIFFTGVPPPGEKEAPAEDAKKAEVKTAAVRQERRRAVYQEPRFFVHGPYGAGQCQRCHAVAASKPFRAAVAPSAGTPTATKKSIGPRLALPIKELCVTCHSDKSNAFANSRHLRLHGPVANGWCVACHNPHRSARPYMLLGKDSAALCTSCHKKSDLLLSNAHTIDPEADCLSCHNPHMGQTAFLLKSTYVEWQIYESGE